MTLARASRWLAVLAGAALVAGCGQSQPSDDSPEAVASGPSAMKLTSNAFENGQPLPAEFTCDGAGRSPQLQWSEPPGGTQSFALIVEDTDAPKGTFRHWGVYDIPMSARQLNTGAAQSVTSGLKQAKNDFDDLGYGPPCPPAGDRPHHYHFRLTALDIPELAATPIMAGDIPRIMGGHVLGTAELVATYGRK
jgi:Raf kinase inhibitor-like YbhB/YbcL family protein